MFYFPLKQQDNKFTFSSLGSSMSKATRIALSNTDLTPRCVTTVGGYYNASIIKNRSKRSKKNVAKGN